MTEIAQHIYQPQPRLSGHCCRTSEAHVKSYGLQHSSYRGLTSKRKT